MAGTSNSHLNGLPAADLYPRLVYGKSEDRIFCQISPWGVVGRESRLVPELQDTDVVYCSPDGRWLILLEHKGPEPAPARRVSIWNLITTESIELPRWTMPVNGSAVLSCSPDDPNCVVYFLMPSSCQLAFCRVGDERWSFFDYGESTFQLGYGHRGLYDPQCRVTVLGDPEAELIYPTTRSFLVPWEDRDLYLIAINFPKDDRGSNFGELPDIRVLAFNFSDNSWYQVPPLRGGAIFLDDSYSLASSSLYNSSCVYYTCSFTRKLYACRLEDGRVTSYAPWPHLCDPCWIMKKPTDNEGSIDDDKQNVSALARWLNVNCPKKSKALENYADCSEREKFVGNGTSFGDLLPELIEKVAEKVSSFVEYTYFLNINRLGSDVARRRGNKFNPCLIYRDKMETSVYHIIDSNLRRQVRVQIPQNARGKHIACSRDGWLLLVEDGRSACLYNPLTRKVIEADGCHDVYKISSFTFIRSPDKNSVLAKSKIGEDNLTLEPSGATEAGKALWWKLNINNFDASSNSPVLVRENSYYHGYGLYCVGRLGRLRLTDMEEGKFEWEVEALRCPCRGKFDSLRCPCKKCYTRNYLTECGGELLSVFIDADYESWVRVFKLVGGDTGKEWEEIHSLGRYCLYLDSASSMSCVAETPDMADRIYFTKFYRGGLVYYSLKTLKYHSIGNEQDGMKLVVPVTMFSDCAWIIPDFTL